MIQPGGGVLAIFTYGGVHNMKGQIQTQKYGFAVNFPPKNIVILHIFKNMGNILVINLIARNYFEVLHNRTERKWQLLKILTPQKWEVHVCKF